MDHVIHEINKEEEYLFWYYVLYIIGSYIINKSELREEDNIVTCIFCGYWILYNIAIEMENMKMKEI